MVALAERLPAVSVAALGVTQIVGYGTLYYSFSILAPEMAAELGWPLDRVFGLLSLSLILGGLVAPAIGRSMDHHGAARVMVVGSVAASLSLALCALSFSPLTYVASLMAMELASGLVLYQAAFAALVEIAPRRASRSITHLTLIAGFASTLFWPLTSLLHASLSWREIYLLFAVLNLCLCLPLHVLVARMQAVEPGQGDHVAASAPVIGRVPPGHRRLSFVLVAMAFALQGFALSAMLVHMVPMLKTIGLGANAVLVGAIFGPSQVLSRFVNMVFGSRVTPPLLAIIASIFIVSAIVLLLAAGAFLPGGLAFAVLLGLGSGLNSIVQGSLPLWLFGSDGYGALTGRMAAARLIAAAAAPFVFAVLLERTGSLPALAVVALLGAAGLVGFLALREYR